MRLSYHVYSGLVARMKRPTVHEQLASLIVNGFDENKVVKAILRKFTVKHRKPAPRKEGADG